MSKMLEYTIQAKFTMPTDRVPETTIEDVHRIVKEAGGTEFKITKQKLVDS